MMLISFSQRGWDDYLYWRSSDRKSLQRVNNLIQECSRTPFAGRGKPEALRGEFSGWWSRRVDREHRLIYRIDHDTLQIVQCRHHY